MATAFCLFCGAALAGINAVYCPRCGKQLPEFAPTSAGQTAPTQAPVAGQPDASAPPQSPIYPSAPSGGYQATPAQYAPPPGAAPSYAAPQPYMAPAAGGGAVGQLYVMAPQSPVTPGRAVGTTAALCAIALVLAAVGVILSPAVLLRDYTLVLIPATAWTLVAAFWLATRLLARQSFGIVLVENAALCLILLLLLPVLDATIFAVVFRLNVRDILRFQSLVWLLPFPFGKDIAILLFAALAALIATSIAAGFAGWSRVRAATHMPLTGWSFVLPGLIVAGGFLLSDFIVSWLFYHGPRIVAVRLLGALLFDVAPIVGLGILAGALSYSALRRPVPAQPQQPPPGTGAAP